MAAFERVLCTPRGKVSPRWSETTSRDTFEPPERPGGSVLSATLRLIERETEVVTNIFR